MNNRKITTILISIISFFMFADQNLIGPNLTIIAQEFNIMEYKDQYLGGLIPLFFWIFGGIITLIIGYYTDIKSRKFLFFIIIFLGEIPCLLSGFATTYTEFFILRVLTGIGIGGIIPLTYSLLGDFYNSNERIKVVTIIGFFSGLGIAVGQLTAGFIGDNYGWRLPFILFSIPNLLLAIIFYLLVKEPERIKTSKNEFKIRNLKDFLSLFKIKTNILVFLQGIFGTIPWSVFSIFLIDFLVIEKGYLKTTATLILTLIGGMAILSSLLGGFIGNKIYNNNPKFLPIFCGITTIIGVIPTAMLINIPPYNEINEQLLIIYAVLTGIFIAMTPPNIKVILMNVNNSYTRGTVFSMYNLADDLGRGFGPFIIGNFLIYFFGRNIAFNIANGFWLICGIFILLMYKTFPSENKKD
tara:strand:- start:2981 stop:4216 length:1236 start_codon:yes stop_codon:yes gene_type:complete